MHSKHADREVGPEVVEEWADSSASLEAVTSVLERCNDHCF